MKVHETVCRNCLHELGSEVVELLKAGLLTRVEPPCDFCREKEAKEEDR